MFRFCPRIVIYEIFDERIATPHGPQAACVAQPPAGRLLARSCGALARNDMDLQGAEGQDGRSVIAPTGTVPSPSASPKGEPDGTPGRPVPMGTEDIERRTVREAGPYGFDIKREGQAPPLLYSVGGAPVNGSPGHGEHHRWFSDAQLQTAERGGPDPAWYRRIRRGCG